MVGVVVFTCCFVGKAFLIQSLNATEAGVGYEGERGGDFLRGFFDRAKNQRAGRSEGLH